MLRGDNSYIFLCPAANSSYNLYTSMREKKKLKIPKKITKHKIQKYCKDPVEDMYKKSFFFLKCLAATGFSVFPCILHFFFMH